MKQILRLLALGALISSSVMADFTKVEMGTGAWMSTSSGEVSYTDSGVTAHDISTKNDTTSPYLWLFVKHPIPIIPNIRLEYTKVNTQGIANGAFENFTAGNSKTELDISQYDIIPYYNILDNTAYITLDLGLDLKVLDLSYTAKGVTGISNGTTYNDSQTLVLPLLYVRTRFEIPTTNIGLEADAKFVKYSSSTVYDARIKVDYTLEFIPLIQPAVEVGYRIQKYDINDNDLEGKIDLEFSGFYVGAMLRF